MVRIGKFYAKHWYLGHFWVKVWVFDPPGWAQIWSTGTVFLFISSVKCSSSFQMVFYGYSTYFKGWKLRKTVFTGFFFRQNLGVRPPVVLRERVISWVFCTFCRWCNTYFKNNLHLSWFFIIRLVKMQKNTQNLTKNPKSQVFSLFQDPLGDRPEVRKFSNNIFYKGLDVF